MPLNSLPSRLDARNCCVVRKDKEIPRIFIVPCLYCNITSFCSVSSNLQTAGDWEGILEQGYCFVSSLPLSLAAAACIVS